MSCIRNESVPKIIINDIFPLSCYSDCCLIKLLPYILFGKYINILLALEMASSAQGTGTVPAVSAHFRSRRAAYRWDLLMVVVVAVVVAFVACWAPFHAQRLMTIYTQDDQWTAALLETQSLLFYISGRHDDTL